MESLKNRRCLVTGAAGFIGRALTARLRDLGAMVLELDLSSILSHTNPYVGVADYPNLEGPFSGYRPEYVFHLAAQTEVLKSFTHPYETYVTNVVGTLNVLELCRLHSSELLGVVIASSDKAYGEVSPHSLPYVEEAALAHAGDVYSGSKRCADDLAHDYARTYGLPVRVLRCANVYGPGQTNLSTLVAGTLHRLLRGERPVVHATAGSSIREWLHLDDAVQAYLLAAADVGAQRLADTFPHAPGRPVDVSYQHRGAFAYNVGSGHTATVKQVVGILLNLFGRPANDYEEVDVGSAPQITDQCLNSARFRLRHPSWRPRGLTAGLADTAATEAMSQPTATIRIPRLPLPDSVSQPTTV